MNNALYVGLSRQMTLKREMDVISNNIANSDTVGFKVESLMLREDVQQPSKKPWSGSAPAEKISFVHDAGAAGAVVVASGGQPLRIDPNKPPPTIAHDGTISQDGLIIGKVGAFKVADRAQLRKEDSGMFDPAGQAATADPATTVQQGMLENSNVDSIQQMTRMIAVSRAYEQVSNMMEQTSQTSDQSIQRLGRVN